ncbi:hypothetical protein BDQ17DRAFT_1329582 [Cyathus striatus]|nr:hypothetical protein BDQ17DRAFT_1329582 [Cyathus striatus]
MTYDAATIKIVRDNLAKRQSPSPPQLTEIATDDWNGGVSYATLVHLANFNSTVVAKKYWKKDILECLLCTQVSTSENVDGKYNPDDYYKAIAKDLHDNMLWTDTNTISIPLAGITINDGQSILDAAKAFVQKTIDVGGAPANDATAFADVTASLAGSSSASTIFNLCATEVKNKSLVTFSVAIAVSGTPANVLELSVYVFHYSSAAPVTDILGAVNTSDIPIVLSGLHGKIKLDENQYSYIRDDVHKLVQGIEGMYILKV